ncbi:hypothetical protein J1N35_008531 [Gossypium stocksii]|uniref:Aminotransferase-like plant mobile domain-containing protein n=1 Tax=Gossypium stocksii TaxID=47602 RepID=A0A9D4AGJ4_9ROSI|nr:hypothetical protein J1N35_008531 [Gossypium stocksii]
MACMNGAECPTDINKAEDEKGDVEYQPIGLLEEDMQLQLRLSVDGSVLTRLDRDRLVTRYIPKVKDDSTEVERIRYTQAYIIEILIRYLMSDKSQNLIHLMWLLKLVDFKVAGELSWGSAMLSTLYWEMCQMTQPNKVKIGGCFSLLHLWAQFHFPFLCPQVNHPYTFPFLTSHLVPSPAPRLTPGHQSPPSRHCATITSQPTKHAESSNTEAEKQTEHQATVVVNSNK